MATVRDVIEKVYTKVNGEYTSLSEVDDDWRTYLNVLNQAMEQLVHTPYVKWQMFFDPNYRLLEPANPDVLSYTIPDFYSVTLASSPFDNVYVVDAKNEELGRYKLVSNAKFRASSDENIATVAGDKVHFHKIKEKYDGASIVIPVYVDPKPYTTAIEAVKVDSIPWLVATMAAFITDSSPVPFIARNAEKYAKQAEYFMKEMRDTNRRNQALIFKSASKTGGHTWQDVLNSGITLRDL